MKAQRDPRFNAGRWSETLKSKGLAMPSAIDPSLWPTPDETPDTFIARLGQGGGTFNPQALLKAWETDLPRKERIMAQPGWAEIFAAYDNAKENAPSAGVQGKPTDKPDDKAKPKPDTAVVPSSAATEAAPNTLPTIEVPK